MPIFNVEITGSMLIIFTLVRLNGISSIPHYLLNGLRMFIPPTQEEIDRIQPPKHKRAKSPPKQKSVQERLDALDTKTFPIQQDFLVNEIFYSTYEQMTLLLLCTVLTFIWCAIFECFFADQSVRPPEWCTFFIIASILFCVYANLKILYLTGLSSTEGSFGVTIGILSFILALLLVFTPAINAVFNPGFDSALEDVGIRAKICLEMVFGIVRISSEDIVFGMKIGIAIVAAFIAAGLGIPSLRYSHCFADRMLADGQYLIKALLYLDLLNPCFTAIMYSKSLSRDLLVPELMSEIFYRRIRFAALLFTCFYHLAAMRPQLQTFLETALRDILSNLERREVDGAAIKLKFQVRIQYLMMAASQYIASGFLLVAVALLFLQKGEIRESRSCTLKTLLDGCGLTSYNETEYTDWGEFRPDNTITFMDLISKQADRKSSGGIESLSNLLRAFQNYVVFTDQFYNGVASFIVFWSCSWYFILYGSGIGFWKVYPDRYDRDDTDKEKNKSSSKKKRK